jgi:hypothetical protein
MAGFKDGDILLMMLQRRLSKLRTREQPTLLANSALRDSYLSGTSQACTLDAVSHAVSTTPVHKLATGCMVRVQKLVGVCCSSDIEN